MLLATILLVTAEEGRLTHTYYALRHGQSVANVANVISSDPKVACLGHGLSTIGCQQAEAAAIDLAATAAREGVDGVAIVSSDLRRAWQTASITRAGCLALGVNVWPEAGVLEARALRERSFGSLSGQDDSRYPEVWAEDAISAEHEEFGCEAVTSVRERGRAVIDELEQLLPQTGTWLVVVVAHGDVLQILQTAFVPGGLDPREHRSLPHLKTATLRRLSSPKLAWQSHDGERISAQWRRDASWPPRLVPS